jgi:hypothetical protein
MEKFFRKGLQVLFPEVLERTVLEATMLLCTPQKLESLTGKTILISDWAAGERKVFGELRVAIF